MSAARGRGLFLLKLETLDGKSPDESARGSLRGYLSSVSVLDSHFV